GCRPGRGELAHLAHVYREASRLAARNPSHIDVLRDRHRLEEAFGLAVLGHVNTALVDPLTRRAIAHRPSAETNIAAMKKVALGGAGDDLGRFRASRADQPEYACDLSRKDREGRVPDDVLHRQILNA